MRNILAVWARHVRRKQRFDRFHALLELRDWLAHGRYWQQRSGIRQASPEIAWRICKALCDVLPGRPDLEAELRTAS